MATPKVQRVDTLVAILRKRYAQVKDDVGNSVAVGYEAPYALFVHENLEVYHPNGQAKYLEKPTREMRSQLQKEISDDIKAGMKPWKAFTKAARKLLAASKELVPVDTGFLKKSGFVQTR